MEFEKLRLVAAAALSRAGLACRQDGRRLFVGEGAKSVALEETFPGGVAYRSWDPAAAERVVRVVRALGAPVHSAGHYSFSRGSGARWFAHVRVTRACNFRCGFCHVDLAGDSLSVREIMAALDEAARGYGLASKDAHVTLSGGEPTLHPAFRELLGELAGRGCHGRVQTNASLFSAPGSAARAFAPGRGRFDAFVSFHSHLPASFTRACATPESAYAQTVAGVREMLRTPGVGIIVNRLFCADNRGELSGYVDFLEKAFLPERPEGFGLALTAIGPMRPGAEGQLVRHTESAAEIAAVLPRLRRLPVKISNDPLFGTGCGIPYCLTTESAPEFGVPPIPAGARPGNALPACAGCAALPVCRGVTQEYETRFGLAELVPMRVVRRPATA